MGVEGGRECGDVGLVPLTGGRGRPLESKLVLFLGFGDRGLFDAKKDATEFRAESGMFEGDVGEVEAGK